MKVISLHEYPVKGMRGNTICCSTVNKRGLSMDRRWMLADSDGNFISQRQYPELSQFLPEFHEQLKVKHIPSGKELAIEVNEFIDSARVQVWGTHFTAHSTQNEINKWFSDILGNELTLVYMADEDTRNIAPPYDDEIVSFADGYPILLTSEASLADLNRRLDTPVPMNRFRANIVIDGDNAFKEDSWYGLKIGSVNFRNAKPSARCKVINIDQEAGTIHKEPLRTLSTFRKKDNKVFFGTNLIPLNSGIIHEGDEVVIQH